MLWMLLALFQNPVPIARSPLPDVSERVTVNRLDLIVNEQCLTHSDLMREIWRRSEGADPEDQNSIVNETIRAYVFELLKTQGGKDLGFEEDLVHRLMQEDLDRRKERAGSASLLGDQFVRFGFDLGSYNERAESRVQAQLWTGSVTGLFLGPGGRHHVDRFVRPGRLFFEYERTPELMLPVTVGLQEMTIDAEKVGDLREAENLAANLRERILLGEDFGEVAVAAMAASDATRGVLQPLEEGPLLIAHPELIPFLEHAEPGELSAVLPMRSPDGVLRGYRVLKLLSRDRSAPPPFSDGVFQQELTLRIQEYLDRAREDAALSRLLGAAYVWPPEALPLLAEPLATPRR